MDKKLAAAKAFFSKSPKSDTYSKKKMEAEGKMDLANKSDPAFGKEMAMQQKKQQRESMRMDRGMK
jgi:hypothetical protein